MNAEPRYNDTYYKFTQVESRIINLRAGTEINLKDVAPPLDWNQVFGNGNPVEIEIGCGKGRFLGKSAKQHPDINYVGVERAPKYVQRTKEHLLKQNVTRTLLVWSDASYFVNRYVARESVKTYHVYFPDPWPKKRQHKRRIFNNELFIKGLIRTLDSTVGCIQLATDIQECYSEICLRLNQFPSLVSVPFEAVRADRIRTCFEIKYLAEGRNIYRAAYRRRHLN
ncbi:MAG: tRNA (guanosine(46)-N7)-methyltransferase TrmB [Candidatus Poribacteria bacterium]|nr:tRNA (guanosine(46)-N7)-methyltransferase TrmB [Candidatus Poribacteria bacterium]